jgi:RimJ/RimL family protein N-acetyltransferase
MCAEAPLSGTQRNATQAKAHGFGILQFNAVVEGNVHARHLYERLGFKQLGTIPRGFRMKDGTFANICPYYKEV